ncbi:MAG: helix-turn-helix transcriptional regulator [Acholeplasmataceae bacterium]
MTILKLKEYRESLKISQRELANLLEITQAHYWKWEKGLSLPNAKQIVRLCEIFKCTPNDLFGFRGVHEVVGQMIDDAE